MSITARSLGLVNRRAAISCALIRSCSVSVRWLSIVLRLQVGRAHIVCARRACIYENRVPFSGELYEPLVESQDVVGPSSGADMRDGLS